MQPYAGPGKRKRPTGAKKSRDSKGYTGKTTYAPGSASHPVTVTDHMSAAERARLGTMVTGYIAAKNPAAATPVQPPSWEQQQAEITAQRDVGIGDAYATFQQGNLDQQYGFGPSGAANPYSLASLAAETYHRTQAGTTNSAAASGNLYAGSTERAQGENTRNYSIAYDQLQRGYNQQSGQIGFDRLRNYAAAGSSVDQARWEAMLKAQGNL